jgi:hypothetical protein
VRSRSYCCVGVLQDRGALSCEPAHLRMSLTCRGIRGRHPSITGTSSSASAAALAAQHAAAATAALAHTPGGHRGRGRPPGSGKRPAPIPSGVLAAGALVPEFPLPPPPPLPPSLARSGSSRFGSQNSLLMEAYQARHTPGKDKLASVGKPGARTWSFAGLDADRPEAAKRSASISLSRAESFSLRPVKPDGDAVQGDEPGSARKQSSSSADAAAGEHLASTEDTSDVMETDSAIQSTATETVEAEFVPGAVGLGSALRVIERASVVSGKVDGGPWTEPELDLLEQLRHWSPVHDLQKAHAALAAQKEILIKR